RIRQGDSMKTKSRELRDKKVNAEEGAINRRTFIEMLPAAGAAGLAAPAVLASVEPQQASTQQSMRVTREDMHATESLIGNELTEAQEAMALPAVNRNLASYESLRKIDVPLDTEPAIAFHPALPGKKFSGSRQTQKNRRAVRAEAPKFNS